MHLDRHDSTAQEDLACHPVRPALSIRQRRGLPERIYEPNIIHNPRTWMGIWTPHGWRVHKKRWGHAQRLTVTLSGDGRTTFFPEALLDPKTRQVEWQDDLHLREDSFTDRGIYPCDPRVEYPPGRPRWAVSHTLLCYPTADHNLYTHEYTWNMTHGHLQTHFRHHVQLEAARTDAIDGRTVQVQHRPISRTIEGNAHYPLPNSAVRGVWSTPDKTGRNHYARRIVQLLSMHNGVYAITPHLPVVQCHGLWALLPGEPERELFDTSTGECVDRERLIESMHIPLDEPKISLLPVPTRPMASRIYEGSISALAEHRGEVTAAHLDRLREKLGSRFVPGCVGYAVKSQAGASDVCSGASYSAAFDFNDDGTIDEADEQRLAPHLGRTVRYNLYRGAYFGGDWLSTSVCLEPEHRPGSPVIADYTYGGGYDGEAGIIRLLETPGPDQPVWVEYHYDAPAEAGENNIHVHLYRETDSPSQ